MIEYVRSDEASVDSKKHHPTDHIACAEDSLSTNLAPAGIVRTV